MTRVLLPGEIASFIPGTGRFADQDGEVRFKNFLDVMRRRWRLVASIAIGGMLAVGALALFLAAAADEFAADAVARIMPRLPHRDRNGPLPQPDA